MLQSGPSAYAAPMPPPTVLVTVGSTRFDALTAAALGAPFVRAVREAMGEDAVVGVQYGLSNVTLPSEARACTMHGAQGHAYVADGVTLFLFRYAPTLEAWVSAATLVVAHGGTLCYSRRRRDYDRGSTCAFASTTPCRAECDTHARSPA